MMCSRSIDPRKPTSRLVGASGPQAASIGLLLTALALHGCGDEAREPTVEAPATVASISVSPESETIFTIGESITLVAVTRDGSGKEISEVPLTWSSADAGVATVDDSGNVTAVGSGSTTITASADGVSAQAIVWVDPDMVLQNYCLKCHGADHVLEVSTLHCPACHSMVLDPSQAIHKAISNGHVTASSGFDLTGAHEHFLCTACHDPSSGLPKYSPTDQNDCIACHEADYQGQHAGSGFPTACLGCHTTTTWTGATFDHASVTGFDLVGAHATLLCESCHDPVTGDPLFNPTSQDDCIACHQADYDQRHSGSGYPTTCLTCHDTDSWLVANFDHDTYAFPIYSGKHQGKWQGDCQTCHTDPNDHRVFTCFNCHQHSQTNADNDHTGVNGYVYDSDQCYACHPDGRAP